MITALKNCIEIIETGKREKGGAVSAGIPSVGAEHLQNDGRVNWAKQSMKYISEDFFSKMKTGKIQPYDVLLVKDGATTGKVAYVDDVPQCGAAINEHVFLMRPKDNLLPKYMYFYLHSPIGKNNVLHFFRGAAIGGISRDFLNAEIKLPSIPVQEEIIRKLSCIDEVIQMCQQMKQEYDNLIKSQFIEMFGDPVTNPHGYPIYSLSDISSSRLGKMLDRKKQTGENSYPYLANYNVQWFRFELENLNEMDFDEADRKEFELKKGDLLVCEGGEVGRCAIWNNEMEGCYFQKALHRVRCNPQYIIPEYLGYTFFWHSQYNGFSDAISGVSTIAHLPGDRLKKLKIIVPPLDLQHSFAEFLQLTDKSKLIIDDLIAENEILRTDVMQQYFV